MTILWQPAPAPFIDPNGNPYRGARAYFFDANTTTPRIVYRDAGLGNAHDHPVVANAAGMFPPVFLPIGVYRLRIEDENGVTFWDVDGVSTPAISDVTPPDTGDVDPTLLPSVGDIKAAYRTGTLSGWVRANGRTIGSAVSGATERANADCEALFQHLWTQDPDLEVSGGRGASAAGDWAADKRIALPDWRGRSVVGLSGMGATALTIIPDDLVDDAKTANDLGASAGAAAVTLTIDEIPAHNHPGTTNVTGAHRHTYNLLGGGPTAPWPAASGGGPAREDGTMTTEGAHSHTVTTQDRGGGEAHNNVQPSRFATIYLKL